MQQRKEQMRVLMTNWVYFPEFSGGALQSHRLAQKLIKRGVNVDVLAGTDNLKLQGDSLVENIKVHRVLRNRKTTHGKLIYGWKLFRFILKNRSKYDVLHAHGFQVPVSFASWITKLPLVQKITNSNLDDPLSVKNRNYSWLYLWIYNFAKVIIPTSKILQESCIKGLTKTPYIKIPNGVDTDLFRPPVDYEKYQLRNKLKVDRDKTILLTVGTISHLKGTDSFIEAIYNLKENTDQDILIWLLGPDRFSFGYNMVVEESVQFSQKIRKMVSYYGLSDVVQFLGRQTFTHEYYRAADIYVHPSRLEGQPNAVLEAMSSGIPVVANLLPGITDDIINPGQCGYVVNCEDTPKFAAALKVLVNNVELRRRLGVNAREEILKYYDLNKIAGQYVDVYNRLVKHQNFNLVNNRVDAIKI